MSANSTRHSALLLSLVLLAISDPEIAAAQSTPPDNAKTREVETVVVTGERRVVNLQSAAVAASVLTADDLRTHDVKGVNDLEYSTPSLTVGANGQSTQINIRGIGKEDNSGTATAAVAIYRDGIGTISGFATAEPYFDIASIEVLRGPQGTFSGENAAGGAIFVNTRDPVFDGSDPGFLEVGYGNYDQHEASGALNLPITDTLGARVAFDHTDRDSFFTAYMDPAATIRNPQPVGAKDFNSARLTLLWKPSDKFDAKIKLDYSDLDNHGYAFSVVVGTPNPGSDFFGNGPYAANISTDPFIVGNNATDNYAKDRMARGSLDMHYTFDNGWVLRSLSGAQWVNSYIRNDDDGSAFVDRRQHINATWHIYSEEVTLASPERDRFNWIAGAFYKQETLFFPPNDGFVLTDGTHYVPGVQVPEITLVWRTPRTTQAIFGQAAYNITDSLKLQAGLRYQHYSNSENSVLAIPILNFTLPTDLAIYKEDTVTGKIALNWQMDESNYFYAFVADGSTTGGVSVVFGTPNFNNQTTTDIEAGWKAQFLENRLFTQIGGFYDFLDGYQAFFTNALGLGTYQNLNGVSTLYGLEASAQAVFDNLSMDAGVSLIKSEMGDATILGAGLIPLQTGGKRQPYTPDYTLHVGAQYAFPLGGDTALTPRFDFAWTGLQTMTPVDQFVGNIPLDRIPPHALLNLKLSYSTPKWNLEAYMTNVTDEIYIEAHGGPGYNAYPNEPRRFGVRLHYNL